MTSAFGDLVHRLHATSVRETFAIVLMTIISDIFLKTEGFEFLPYPVEMIMQVVRAMRRQPEIYAHLPSETLSRFIWAVIRVTKELLHSDKFVRNEPVSALDASNRADLCFQVSQLFVLISMNIREKVFLTDASLSDMIVHSTCFCAVFGNNSTNERNNESGNVVQ
uniref:Uncharacterized protein n=1 Tax=Parascaris equorum TaxID=6256 RepID=A0A914SAE0_PAREQ